VRLVYFARHPPVRLVKSQMCFAAQGLGTYCWGGLAGGWLGDEPPPKLELLLPKPLDCPKELPFDCPNELPFD
jgi:hypothetical protein